MNKLISTLKISIKNKVSWLIILIVVIGFVYNVGYHFDWWPIYKSTLWNGEKGFNTHWHIWLNMNYAFGFVLSVCNFIEKTRTDINFLRAFVLFDVFGWLSYNYCGWPEPVYLFIIGFCLSTIAFIVLDKWKN